MDYLQDSAPPANANLCLLDPRSDYYFLQISLKSLKKQLGLGSIRQTTPHQNQSSQVENVDVFLFTGKTNAHVTLQTRHLMITYLRKPLIHLQKILTLDF